jgi:hypothetical protein
MISQVGLFGGAAKACEGTSKVNAASTDPKEAIIALLKSKRFIA